MLEAALFGLFAFLVSMILTPVVRSAARRFGIGDYPGARKVHAGFIPRMGGAAFVCGFACAVSLNLLSGDVGVASPISLIGVASGLLMIVVVGVYDDVFGVGSVGKLLVQLAASIVIIASGLSINGLSIPLVGYVELGVWAYPITILWLVGLTNAVNLLDGLDGLAGGVSAIVAGVFLVIGAVDGDALLMATSAALLFACLGFLRYNFHPASIFMGDTGSLFLGFLLACMGIYISQYVRVGGEAVSFLVPIVALAVPIVDTSVAFFRRLKRGMHPLKADKEHIHHRLMDLGLTHRQTVVVNYAVSMVHGVIALMIVLLDPLYGVLLTVFVFVSAFLAIWRLGYLEEMTAKRKASTPPIRPLSIARIIDRAILVGGDLLAVLLAFLASYWFRFHSGLSASAAYVPLGMYVEAPALLLLVAFWIMLFIIAGLYEIPWDTSRIDYSVLIFKTVAVGTLVMFMATLDLSSVSIAGRLTTIVHGGFVLLFVVSTRMLIIAIERKHEILGFRRRNTLIVGATDTARELLEDIEQRPGLKYSVVGFVDRHPSDPEYMGLPVLGTLESIPRVVKERGVEEILVATGYESREEILDIVARCNGMVTNVKVVPESTDMLSGFKTEEVVGHPLIRLYPTNLKPWQRAAKRLIDISVALVVLIPFLPLWTLVALLIKMDSQGPIFFVQERVGKRGRLFRLLKFRSMVADAEKETGPIWAQPDDKRVTRVGRILRKLRLDEIPQFINVLKGEMSLVGPRPERPFFVDQLQREVKFYTRRLLVRPGITGWAQVRHRYDRSLEDVKAKVKYDLFYLENMSLMLDLKIILRTILVAISGRGTH